MLITCQAGLPPAQPSLRAVTKSYFGVLCACIAVSVFVLALGHFDPTWPIWIHGVLMAGALAPLAFYHVGFLWLGDGRKGGPGAIDSVYYYGFLLTVGALALSAMDLALQRGDTNVVLFNFGLGLAATGYAVLARLHLLSMADAEEDAVAAPLSYTERSGALLNDLELATVRIREFSETVQREIVATHRSALAEADKRLLDTASSLDDQLKVSFGSATGALNDVRNLVREVSFEAERVDLKTAVADAVKSTKKLGVSIAELADQTKTSAEAAKHSGDSLAQLRDSVSRLSESIETLGGPQGSLVSASQSLTLAAASSERATQATNKSFEALNGLASELADVSGAIGKMRQFADATSGHFAQMSVAAGQAEQALSQLAQVSGSGRSVANGLTEASEALPQLAERSRALATSLASLKESLVASADALERDVATSSKASSMLVDSLLKVATTVVDGTREHQRSAR